MVMQAPSRPAPAPSPDPHSLWGSGLVSGAGRERAEVLPSMFGVCPVCLVYAGGMFGVCWCTLVYVAMWLAVACAAVTGYVVWCGGVWVAGYVVGCVHEHMVVWLAGSLALLETKAILAGKFQRIFGLKIAKNAFKIAEKSPQNRRKIRGNFGGFQPDFRTAKTKTEKPKTQNPHQKPKTHP